MASTYPLEVVQAARWAKANPNVKGKALEDTMQKQPWDASVKSLTAFPTVLDMMNDKLDWTQQLGDAFLAQQQDVLAAVQALRERADKAGNLKTTKQQKVTKGSSGAQSYIAIEPQDPSVVYVPAYDPNEVYGTWPYASYPPYYWYPPGYVAGPGVWWGAGIIAGGILWGIANWGRNEINIDVNRYNRFNRTNITNGRWEHNVAHRKGVPYANRRLNDQFRRPYQGNFAASREQFRGRAEAGRAALAGAAAGAASGAAARQALSKRPSQLPARVGQANRPRATAFDRAGSGRNARAASARGRTSRAASINRGGGGRASVVAADFAGVAAAEAVVSWPRSTVRPQGQARHRSSWPAFKRDGPLSLRLRWQPETLCRRDRPGGDEGHAAGRFARSRRLSQSRLRQAWRAFPNLRSLARLRCEAAQAQS